MKLEVYPYIIRHYYKYLLRFRKSTQLGANEHTPRNPTF